ncbi:MFS transporter [Micromonospora sp. NPDC049559]|uniref:MFS transporter n=1 Tax=Micromonospora sp. NPDC049559 TaxID=3155923 RepID=UPI00342A22CD
MTGALAGLLRPWQRPRDVPPLPPPARLFVLANALSACGAGLAMPYFAGYLVGFDGAAATAAGVLATIAVVDIVAQWALARRVERRRGSRASAIAGCWVQAVAWALIAGAGAYWQVLAAAVLLGLGNALFFSVRINLQLQIVPDRAHEYSFALRYLLGNLGMTLGGLLGGTLVAWFGTGASRGLMAANSATFVAFALVLAMAVPADAPDPARRTDPKPPAPGAGRPVRFDLALPGLVLAYFCLVTTGLAQFETVLPLQWTTRDGLAPSMAGYLFSALTLCTSVVQLPVSRLATRLGGVNSIRTLCAAWAVGAVVLAAARYDLALAWRAGILLLGVVALAVGECMFSPSIPGLLRTADEGLRRRAGSALAMAHSIGMFVGPSLGVVLVTHAPLGAYGLIILGAALAATVVRPLDPAARRTPEEPGRRAVAVSGGRGGETDD